MRKLANALNRSVFVASPAFFGDQDAHRCILVDMEATGLWLRGDAVSARLREIIDTSLPEDAPADVFIPFDQIVCVFDPTQFAFLARGLARPASREKPAATEQPAAAEKPRGPSARPAGSRHRNEPSKHKTSKRTR